MGLLSGFGAGLGSVACTASGFGAGVGAAVFGGGLISVGAWGSQGSRRDVGCACPPLSPASFAAGSGLAFGVLSAALGAGTGFGVLSAVWGAGTGFGVLSAAFGAGSGLGALAAVFSGTITLFDALSSRLAASRERSLSVRARGGAAS